jgi:hypothetical protein
LKVYFINTKIQKIYKINRKLNLKIINNDLNFYGNFNHYLNDLNISSLNLLEEIFLQTINFIEDIPLEIKFILYENTKYIFTIKGISIEFILQLCLYFKIKKFLQIIENFNDRNIINNYILKKYNKKKKKIKKLQNFSFINLFNLYDYYICNYLIINSNCDNSNIILQKYIKFNRKFNKIININFIKFIYFLKNIKNIKKKYINYLKNFKIINQIKYNFNEKI